MNRDDRKKPGRRIRGKLDPFLNTVLEDSHKLLSRTREIVCLNALERHRDYTKDACATRMFHGAMEEGKPANWRITDGSKKIITQKYANHPNPHVLGFFMCSLDYANQDVPHLVSLNLKFVYRKKKKSIQQARQDCRVLMRRWVFPLRKKLESQYWRNTISNDTQKYLAIEEALPIFCDYIVALCANPLPKDIEADTYHTAIQYDPRLASHYKWNDNKRKYLRKSGKNHRFSSVTQECATAVFFMEK